MILEVIEFTQIFSAQLERKKYWTEDFRLNKLKKNNGVLCSVLT